MVKCVDCGKEIPKDEAVYCDMCGAPLRQDCGAAGLCSKCTEFSIVEIDLEDTEAEENT